VRDRITAELGALEEVARYLGLRNVAPSMSAKTDSVPS